MNTKQPTVTILVFVQNGRVGLGLLGNKAEDGSTHYHWYPTMAEAGEDLGGMIRLYSKAGTVVVEDVDARRARLRDERARDWARARYGHGYRGQS